MEQEKKDDTQATGEISRRSFVGGIAAAAGIMIVKPTFREGWSL